MKMTLSTLAFPSIFLGNSSDRNSRFNFYLCDHDDNQKADLQLINSVTLYPALKDLLSNARDQKGYDWKDHTEKLYKIRIIPPKYNILKK